MTVQHKLYNFFFSYVCVINYNWSARKQHLHLQSAAEISRHSVLSGTGFDNLGYRLGLATRTQISVCKSPFPSAGTAVSLFRAKMWRSAMRATQTAWNSLSHLEEATLHPSVFKRLRRLAVVCFAVAVMEVDL